MLFTSRSFHFFNAKIFTTNTLTFKKNIYFSYDDQIEKKIRAASPAIHLHKITNDCNNLKILHLDP